MGLDFVRRAAPSFHKTLDRRAIELRTPKLFSNNVTVLSRTAQVEICAGSTLAPGEKLLVRKIGDDLILQRDNLVVGKFCNPPGEYLELVNLGAGIAGGEIKAVHAISQVAEVCLCE
jgi:hypothetical protein